MKLYHMTLAGVPISDNNYVKLSELRELLNEEIKYWKPTRKECKDNPDTCRFYSGCVCSLERLREEFAERDGEKK